MLVKSEERNRSKWKLGVVDTPIEGRDGVVRDVRLRSGKSFIERPIQHFYPLELACEVSTQREAIPLNPECRGQRIQAEQASCRGCSGADESYS